ncbi:MAG TPA: hypothetical protein DDY13_08445 [Cytophagales bacterium]|jgi:hypothetical protein|nr:hypothetical protein [Cytophagales bacterium]
MLKRQNKFLISFLTLFFTFTTLCLSETYKELDKDIVLADSLFQARKYTQSFDLYHDILHKHSAYSPAMLIKMAFIKEGLSDYPSALYYLNLYYQVSAQKKVLEKMEKLAETHGLSGYNYDDLEYFQFVYKKNKWIIVTALAAIALGLMVWTIIEKRKTQKVNGSLSIFVVVFLTLAFVMLNFSPQKPKGIIQSPVTHIMEGPSIGAEVIDVIKGGHRVNINDRKDIWVEIEWKNNRAYVHKNHLKEVRL